jgi:hypothetical protein
MSNVVPIRKERTSEWLEALARKPFARNREILLDLAERLRAIEAVLEDEHDHHNQLDLGVAA